MKARSALPLAGIRTALALGLLGLVLGFVTGARLAGANPSIRPADAWVVAWNAGALYGLGGGLAGLGLAVLTRLFVRAGPGVTDAPFRGALVAGVGACAVGFACLGLASSNVGQALAGILAAAVAVVLFAWGRRRPALGAWVLAGFAAVWLAAGYSVVTAASDGPSGEYVPFEAPFAAPEAPVVLVGIDGADWARIDALVAEGRLPAIARLVSEGVRAPLATTTPTWSPILWTTISTGTLAPKHGVLDFAETPLPGLPCGVQRLRKTPLVPEGSGLRTVTRLLYGAGLLEEQPISARHRRVKALWNVVSDVGGRVAVINWFASWPCEPVNGFMVSDRNPKRAAFLLDRHGLDGDNVSWGVAYPPELLAELAELTAPQIGPEPLAALELPIFDELTPKQRASLERDEVLEVFRHIYESDGLALAAARELLRSQRIDLAAVYTSGVDNVSHRFRQTGVVDRYYEYVDAQLAAVLDAAGPGANVALVSDHGFEYEDEQRFAHEHGPDGVLILSGPAFRRGARLAGRPTIADVAPTLLALLGLPLAATLDGEPVVEAFEPGWLSAHPVTRVASYGAYAPPGSAGAPRAPDALQDEVMQKLRALGYVAE
jgi:hypothetical protein